MSEKEDFHKKASLVKEASLVPVEESSAHTSDAAVDLPLESLYVEEKDYPVHQGYGHGYLGYNQGYQGYEGQSFQGYAAQSYQGYRDNENYVHINFSMLNPPHEYDEDIFMDLA